MIDCKCVVYLNKVIRRAIVGIAALTALASCEPILNNIQQVSTGNHRLQKVAVYECPVVNKAAQGERLRLGIYVPDGTILDPTYLEEVSGILNKRLGYIGVSVDLIQRDFNDVISAYGEESLEGKILEEWRQDVLNSYQSKRTRKYSEMPIKYRGVKKEGKWESVAPKGALYNLDDLVVFPLKTHHHEGGTQDVRIITIYYTKGSDLTNTRKMAHPMLHEVFHALGGQHPVLIPDVMGYNYSPIGTFVPGINSRLGFESRMNWNNAKNRCAERQNPQISLERTLGLYPELDTPVYRQAFLGQFNAT